MSDTALLFPGQGSQEPGMGRELAERFSDIMDLWKKAERASALPLREIFWEGDENAMADTKALQPALTVVNLSLWSQLASRLRPCATAGHSLGEFSAMAAAGILNIDDVLDITALRGKLMAEADPDSQGAMAAIVKLPLESVEALVAESAQVTEETLLIANYNTPAQFVISGTQAAVAHAANLTKEHKGRALMLKVSGAFHSPLMRDAAKEFLPRLRKATWSKPRFPVYCNLHGRPVSDGESACEALCAQMTASVLWIDTIRNQYQNGARRWLELGPKAVLSKMVAPILTAGEKACTPENISVQALCTAEDIEAFEA